MSNVNLITGTAGSGKTRSLIDIAQSELKKRNKVLFISFENNCKAIEKDISKISKNYYYINQHQKEKQVIDFKYDKKLLQLMYFNYNISREDLEFMIHQTYFNPNVILVDMISISTTFNNSSTMKNIYKFLNHISKQYNSFIYATIMAPRYWY